MNKTWSIKYTFLLLGFTSIFIISLIGITIEDLIHNIPIIEALSSYHHYMSPLVLGVLGAILGFYIWKYQANHEKALLGQLQAEQKFRMYIEYAGDAIFLHDEQGKILGFNKVALTELGYTAEEMERINFFDLNEVNGENSYRQGIRKLNIDTPVLFETNCKRKNGDIFPLEIKVCKINENKRPVFLSIARNMTLQNLAIETLKKSKNRYQNLFNEMIVPFAVHKIVYDDDGNPTDYIFLDVNPAFEKALSIKKEDYVGKTVLELMPETEKHWIKRYGDVALTGKSIQFVEYSSHFNKWFETLCFCNEPGQFSVTFNDITAQKKAEQKIKESEERFKMLSSLTFEGILLHDKGIIKEANTALVNMLGYEASNLRGKSILETFVHPNYANMVEKYLDWDYSPPYEIEGIKKDGSSISLELESKNIKFENEFRRVTAVRNISKRRMAEENLKRFYTAVENSANLIVITDSKANIEYVNQRFGEITGYSTTDVIGKNMSVLKSGKHDESFYNMMWQTVAKGLAWKGEFCNKKKNGEIFWQKTIITPIYNQKKELINYIAVAEDITDQLESEKRLFEAIIETEEKERKRFAEDLHDELGPFLSGIKLYINELSYNDISEEKRKSLVSYVTNIIDETVNKARAISHQLMPNVLMDYGLTTALESFCDKINNTEKITIKLKNELGDTLTNKTIEVVLYRIAIELINNTIKHANAQIINIELYQSENSIEFIYTDDGKGFNFQEMLKNNNGIGLQNMVNRLESFKGTIEFKNLEKNGILYKIKIPR